MLVFLAPALMQVSFGFLIVSLRAFVGDWDKMNGGDRRPVAGRTPQDMHAGAAHDEVSANGCGRRPVSGRTPQDMDAEASEREWKRPPSRISAETTGTMRGAWSACR